MMHLGHGKDVFLFFEDLRLPTAWAKFSEYPVHSVVFGFLDGLLIHAANLTSERGLTNTNYGKRPGDLSQQ
jgi:hypothetical protein